MKNALKGLAVMTGLAALVGVAFIAVGEALMEDTEDTGREEPETEAKDDIKEGDFVQWECNGQYMFPHPKRVRYIVDSKWGRFVYVEGSNTAVPYDQVEIA